MQLTASAGLVWFLRAAQARLLLALVSYRLALPHCSCLVLDLWKMYLKMLFISKTVEAYGTTEHASVEVLLKCMQTCS